MTEKTKAPQIRITLTAEQQARIEQETGQRVTILKLEALEARLAPGLQMN